MKKIPTLFKREFDNHSVCAILNEVTPGYEWVLNGEGDATVKIDGSCCAVMSGELFKRFDAKPGKSIPMSAIPCCDPDPITGHWPHWVKVDATNPADQWFVAAFKNTMAFHNGYIPDGTYEAIGLHFQGNPYKMPQDELVPHGKIIVEVERSFAGIKKWLEEHKVEGLVFWKDGEPKCKIKRRDFGLPWPIKEEIHI